MKSKILGLLKNESMTEAEIRDALHISHGSFFAAKEELIKEGLIDQIRIGRVTVYQRVPPVKEVEKVSPVKENVEKVSPAKNVARETSYIDEIMEIPAGITIKSRIDMGIYKGRATGVFETISDWIDCLIETLEDSQIVIRRNPSGSQLIVTCCDGAQQLYSIDEVAGGFEIL